MKQEFDVESRNALIKHRINRAKETLGEAAVLYRENYYNAAVNRLYYACYYAAIALLLKKNIQAQTHAGVKTMFGLHFIATDIVPIEIGKTLSTLFEKRQSGDYDDFIVCTANDVEVLSEQANSFVNFIQNYLDNNN